MIYIYIYHVLLIFEICKLCCRTRYNRIENTNPSEKDQAHSTTDNAIVKRIEYILPQNLFFKYCR